MLHITSLHDVYLSLANNVWGCVLCAPGWCLGWAPEKLDLPLSSRTVSAARGGGLRSEVTRVVSCEWHREFLAHAMYNFVVHAFRVFSVVWGRRRLCHLNSCLGSISERNTFLHVGITRSSFCCWTWAFWLQSYFCLSFPFCVCELSVHSRGCLAIACV